MVTSFRWVLFDMITKSGDKDDLKVNLDFSLANILGIRLLLHHGPVSGDRQTMWSMQ